MSESIVHNAMFCQVHFEIILKKVQCDQRNNSR